MLAQRLELHDIKDAEGFVHATIYRARLILSTDEREELVAEGLAILCKLASDYKPRIDGLGHAGEGRFSGYASQFLPRKLGDAWHRMHPEHTLRAQTDGKRRWQYGEKAVSLEAITAQDPDRHMLLASPTQTSDIEARLRSALWERAKREIDMAVQVGAILADGGHVTDAAQMLGLTSDQVRGYVDEIGKITHRLQSEAA